MRLNIGKYWTRKKSKLKQLYPFITDNDLKFRLGEEYKMIKTLCDKVGVSQQEILHLIVTI